MSGISFRELDPHDRYKLLCGVVVPRPIALVTTLDENGSVNAAPAATMNDCAIDFPSGDSEVEATGLKTLPSIDIAVPRLAAAPFALECRQHVVLAFGPGRELLVGEVLRLHAREGLIDQEKMYVDFDVYRPIGRLFGNLYAAQRDTFELTRKSHAQWLARNGEPDTSGESQ